MALNLTVYDIIKGPVLTEKAYKQYQKLQKLVLDIHAHANKKQVAEAIEKLFNVKVKDVRVLVRKGKTKNIRVARKTTQDPLRKRAYVTLAAGHSLDLLGQGNVVEAGASSPIPTQPE
jgi:large subunit ribosomal protein L23